MSKLIPTGTIVEFEGIQYFRENHEWLTHDGIQRLYVVSDVELNKQLDQAAITLKKSVILPTLKEQIDFMKMCVNNHDVAHPASQEMVEAIYQSLLAARIYQHIGDQEQKLVTNLRTALKQSIEIIRKLRSGADNEDVAEQKWARYYSEHPEMVLIREQHELGKAVTFCGNTAKPEILERSAGDDYPVVKKQ